MDLVANAVRFLNDPKVQNAPMEKKIAFLKSKGLNEEEIEKAMAQVKAPMAPPRPPMPITPSWTDRLFSLASISALAFAGYQAFQYFYSSSIANYINNANETVHLAKQETSTLIKLLESQSNSIQTSVKELEKALETMESQPLSELVQDIEQLKDKIPMLLDHHKEKQTALLMDLQSELKSLKSLLAGRKTEDSVKSPPAIPAWQLSEKSSEQ